MVEVLKFSIFESLNYNAHISPPPLDFFSSVPVAVEMERASSMSTKRSVKIPSRET